MDLTLSFLVREPDTNYQRLVEFAIDGTVRSDRFVAPLGGFDIEPPSEFGQHSGEYRGLVEGQDLYARPVCVLPGGVLYQISYYNARGAEIPVQGLLGYALLPVADAVPPAVTPTYLLGQAAFNVSYLDNIPHRAGAIHYLPPRDGVVYSSEYLQTPEGAYTRLVAPPASTFVGWHPGGIVFADGHTRLVAVRIDKETGAVGVRVSPMCAPGWDLNEVALSYTSTVPIVNYEDVDFNNPSETALASYIAAAFAELAQHCAGFGELVGVSNPTVCGRESTEWLPGGYEYFDYIYPAVVYKDGAYLHVGVAEPSFDMGGIEGPVLSFTSHTLTVDAALDVTVVATRVENYPTPTALVGGHLIDLKYTQAAPRPAFWAGFNQTVEVIE